MKNLKKKKSLKTDYDKKKKEEQITKKNKVILLNLVYFSQTNINLKNHAHFQ